MEYFYLIMAGLILGVKSRSLNPSSFEEELREAQWNPTVEKIEEIFPQTEALNYFVNSNKIDQREEFRSLLVSQGEKLEKLLTNFAGKTKTDGVINNEQLEIFQNINSLKDLVDSIQELDIYYQDSPQDDVSRHVKSRYEDSSAQFPLVRDETRGFEIDTEVNEDNKNDENEVNDVKELDNMLVDVQNQINRMRKYFGKLCSRKRHSTTAETSDTNREISASFSSGNPKKISLIN